MSRDTGIRLIEEGYRLVGSPEEVTSRDLERWYYETGYQVGGITEMRWAWKFNDLKPRAYYCMGGQKDVPDYYVDAHYQSFPSSEYHPDVNYEQLAYMGVTYQGY